MYIIIWKYSYTFTSIKLEILLEGLSTNKLAYDKNLREEKVQERRKEVLIHRQNRKIVKLSEVSTFPEES